MPQKIRRGDLLFPMPHIREGSHAIGYVLDDDKMIVDAKVIEALDFPLLALDSEIQPCKSKFNSPHYVRGVVTATGHILHILSEYIDWDVVIISSLSGSISADNEDLNASQPVLNVADQCIK